MTDKTKLDKLVDVLNNIISINPHFNKRAKAIYRKLLNEYFTAERCISFVALYRDIAPDEYNLCSKIEVQRLLDKLEEALN